MIFVPEYINWQGYAALYGYGSEHSNSDAVAFLREAGLSLRIPGSTDVLVLEGLGEERIDLPEPEFWNRLGQDETIMFKTWIPGGVDLLCSLRQGSWWYEYYFIGYLQREAVTLVSKLLDRFTASANASSPHMLVVDWQARAEDIDWDAFWRDELEFDSEMPEILGIPKRLQSRLAADMTGITVRELPDHVLLSRRPVTSAAKPRVGP